MSAIAAATLPIGCAALQISNGALAVTRDASRTIARSGSQAILYVSDSYGYGAVTLYTFPQGNYIGALDLLEQPGAMCTDTLGNVFVTESYVVAEYAPGATEPNMAFPDPYVAFACAVDPTSGDLAVANSDKSIGIVNRRSGSAVPTYYTDSNVAGWYYLSYDAQGNLFAIGYTFASAYRLFELRKGTSTLTQVNVPVGICCPLWIQWDGTYLAIDTPHHPNPIIYQLKIAKYKATVAGKVKIIGGSSYTAQGWIDGDTIIHPDYYNANVGFWSYPAGGKAWKTISGAGHYIVGVTVSNPPSENLRMKWQRTYP